MDAIPRALAIAFVVGGLAHAQPDLEAPATRIARELDRAEGLLASGGTADDLWKQIEAEGPRSLDLAREALRAGHPWLALQRITPTLLNLAGSEFVRGIPLGKRNDEALFEAERTRMREVLADSLGAAPPEGIAKLQPVALRALAECAWLNGRELFDTSLEYARSTETRFGFFYVGQASGARDVLALCRALAGETPPTAGAEPPLRSLAPDVDQLERELFAAYVPPRSLLLHGEFITASSLLKEARELDAAGLRDGALLRLLQAAQYSAKLRSAKPALDDATLERTLREFDERAAKSGRDDSLARLFLDAASMARAGKSSDPPTANAIATDVLPRWFAAQDAAAPAPPVATPRATVTVVRWPFT